MSLIRVATPESPGFSAHWSIYQGLTDRWGELNDSFMDAEAYHVLVKDEALTRRLVMQLWDDITFVAQKDGVFGVLFEGEFPCTESDGTSGEIPANELLPYADEVAGILARIPALEAAFPGVQFCVPDKVEMLNGRAGLWAFVPDGTLPDPLTRRQLGHAVLCAGGIEPDVEIA